MLFEVSYVNMELFLFSVLCIVTIVKATGLAAVVAYLNT